jgi:hypothetical protein
MTGFVLTTEAVENIFGDCLAKDFDATDTVVKAEGITTTAVFHPERLEANRLEINKLLDELPPQFGDGWSFLNACDDKTGRQWTSLHARMEQLFQLGIAIGRVRLLAPRKMWSSLPGGMPYYVVLEPDTTGPPADPDTASAKGGVQ